MEKIIAAHVGQPVTFHGHDGHDYAATITKVRQGTAVLDYQVPSVGTVTAYVDLKRERARIDTGTVEDATPLEVERTIIRRLTKIRTSERRMLIRVLNAFGTGDAPEATEKNLAEFGLEYARCCINRAVADRHAARDARETLWRCHAMLHGGLPRGGRAGYCR